MQDCLFCKIIKGEIPSKIIYHDKDVVVFHDINPKAPVHVLIVPVRHIESLKNIKDNDALLLGRLMLVIREIAKKMNIDTSGFKIVANNGIGAGQIVPHLHFHLLGGWGRMSGWKV